MKPGHTFFRAALLFVTVALATQALLPGFGSPTPVAYAQAASTMGTPIKQMLNSDGSLNLATGFSGNLDPDGYEMQVGQGGQPRFVPLSDKKGPATNGPDDPWDSRFGFQGLNDAVFAIAVSGDDIYVGGAFTATQDGSVSLKHIARWSKSEGKWHPMRYGLNSTVKAIVVAGGVVYAGGLFTASGDGAQVLTHVAMYQNSAWLPMAGGLGEQGSTDEEVRVMLADGSRIYAAGVFAEACVELCAQVNHIAYWDPVGQMWNPIDGGVDNVTGIYDMAMSSAGLLYIGGGFNHAGGLATNDIAYLVGGVGGQWYPLGNPGGIVHTIAITGSGSSQAIYIAGDFGGPNYCCVEKWNSNTYQWDYLMDSIHTGIDFPTGMATYGSDLYISGEGRLGSSRPYIIKWNGSTWSEVGNSDGISGCTSQYYSMAVKTITISGGDIYAGGCFINVPGLTEDIDNIAKWNINDSKWLGMNGGMNGTVHAVLVHGTDVYVGGSFSEAGGIKANSIARWDGSRWSNLSGGVNDQVNALGISPDGRRLYAGGPFTLAGASNGVMKVSAKHVATLDLTCNNCSWQSLGSGLENGLDDTVSSIAVSNSSVYVGGSFMQAGTVSAPRIAMWNLTTLNWHGLGGGLNDNVYVLALNGSDLYAGGKFTQTLSPVMSVSHIARLNTISGVWSPLGYSWSNGVNGNVYAIAVSGSSIYTGGAFTQAMGQNAAHIARWNGSAWSALGGGLDSNVNALAVVGTKVYAGGSFIKRTAFWDGASWFYPGTGIGSAYSTVTSLSANTSTGDLYVGGLFLIAGGKASRYIALYHGQP